jgi:riboflavin kinase/FMN adenylyltransferase
MHYAFDCLSGVSTINNHLGECMKKMIYALGYFDGVHLGHRALLNSCRELAQKAGCGCGAITFSVHPQQLLQERQVRLARYSTTKTGC